MGKMTASYRYRVVKQTDARIRILNEIIQGIQTIKMYAWEEPFKKIIGKIRKWGLPYHTQYIITLFLVLIFIFSILNFSEKSCVEFVQFS